MVCWKKDPEGRGRSVNRKIQVLRGFAIAAVIVCHSYPHGIRGIFVRPPVNFAVALFLFLSGWLTGLERRPYRYWLRRCGRVLVPYVLWSLIYTAYHGTWATAVGDLLTGGAEIQMYYILVYIQFALLTPLLQTLARSRWRRTVWLVTPVTMAAVRYLPAVLGTEPPFPFPAANALVWCTFYFLGMVLGGGAVKADLAERKGWAIYALTVCLGMAEGLFWFKAVNYDMATGQLRFSSLLSSVTVLLLAHGFLTDSARQIRPGWMEKGLVFLGNVSSGVYFSHRAVTFLLQDLVYPGRHVPFPITTAMILAGSAALVWAGQKLLGKRWKWVLGF